MKNTLHLLLYLLLGLSIQAQGTDRVASQPKLVIPTGHTGMITELHVSKNERLLSSYGYQEGLSKLWDVQTGKQLELTSASGQVGHYQSYQILPNRKYLSVSSLEGIDVLEVGSNKLVLHIEDSVYSTYSLDKSQLLVEQKEYGKFKIYSTENFELVREITNLPEGLYIASTTFLGLDAQHDLLFLNHSVYKDNGEKQEYIGMVYLPTNKIVNIPINGSSLDVEQLFGFGLKSDLLLTQQKLVNDETNTTYRIYNKTTGEKVSELVLDVYTKKEGVTIDERYLWYTYDASYGWEPNLVVVIYDLQTQETIETVNLEDYKYYHEMYKSKYFALEDWLTFDPAYKFHDEAKVNYLSCSDIPDLENQFRSELFYEIEKGTQVQIKNIQTDSLISAIDLPNEFRIYSAIFLNHGANVIVAYDNEIALFDVFTGQKIRDFESNSEKLTVVRADSLEKHVVLGTNEGRVHMFKKNSNQFKTITIGESEVNDLLVVDSVLVCGGENSLTTWNLSTQELMLDFSTVDENWIGDVAEFKMQKVGNRILLNTKETFLLDDFVTVEYIYDLTTGERVLSSPDIKNFSTKHVIYQDSDSTYYVWNYLDTARALATYFKSTLFGFWQTDVFKVSPDGNYIMTVTGNNMQIWNLTEGRRVKELKFKKLENYYQYQFDRKSQTLVFTDVVNAFKIDLKSGKLLNTWENISDFNLLYDFLVMKSRDDFGKTLIYELASGKLIDEITMDIRPIDYIENKQLLVLKEYNSNAILYYDLKKKQVVAKNANELNFIKERNYFFDQEESESITNPDANSLFGILGNEMLKFDFFNGTLGYRVIPLGEDQMITVLPNGYYQATKDAAKMLHYVTPDLKVITFDQLDLRFNRPDKVLQAIGNTDTLLINSYRKAYEKRIRKMGVDTTVFNNEYSVPQVDFVNRDKVTSVQSSKDLKLQIRGWDSTFRLDRFNVWINEIPIFGEQGVSVKNRKINYFDTTLIIELSNGVNRIETSIINSNQIESYRMPLYVNFESPVTEKAKVKTYFIGIGIDHFQEPDHDLSYSVKDVRDLAKALKAKLGEQLSIDTLFNQNVSISNVQALKKRLLETNINDKVIISYSGHGLLSKEYDYYLSSYTVNFHQPEIGGIPYEVLENLLDSIPARQKLLLIDACHSGEVDKDDFREMAAVAGAKGIVKPKGGDAENTATTNTVGLQNSFQLMQELFVNVQKGSGATIISAAAGDQFALEGGKLENGFFTYAILQYIANNQLVGINDLKRYVYTEVERLSGGLQKPTSRIENLELDWRMW